MGFNYISRIKHFLFLGVAIVSMAGCIQEEEPYVPPSTSSQSGVMDNWTLVFEDQFDNGLSYWDQWYGGAYNNEIQLYRSEQLSTDNGILKINVQRQNISGPATNVDGSQKNFEYVSGRIESLQQYGPSDYYGEREYRFVSRIKLPFGHGMWPAFWTYGDPWPTKGEIDILEARGGEPMKYLSNIFYGPNPGTSINYDTDVDYNTGQNLTTAFHTYEMIWRANSIDIIFDGQLMHSYTANNGNNIANFFGRKQKIVFNTAVGGWFFSDQNSANYANNALMEVDWVRVYKR